MDPIISVAKSGFSFSLQTCLKTYLKKANNEINNQTKPPTYTYTQFNQYLDAHIANEFFNCHIRQFIIEILKGINAKMQILEE